MDSKNKNLWKVELEIKPDFKMAMKRIYAWYDGSIIDRVPVRFSRHNVEYENVDSYNEWQGKDKPIMQWVPLIKKIQRAGKSVVVDLDRNELEEFIQSIKPEGLFLCIESENEEMEDAIIKRIEKW